MSIEWTYASDSVNSEKLRLLALNGEESISAGYTFDVLLLVKDMPLKDIPNFLEVLIKEKDVKLTCTAHAGSFTRHGIVTTATHVFNVKNDAAIRLIIKPHSYSSYLSIHSRIFLDMSLPDILTKALQDDGLHVSVDFENNMQEKFKSRPFTCQYNERTSRFITRHLERVGGYSYIAQGENGDTLILADGKTKVEDLPLQNNLTFSQGQEDGVVYAFCRSRSRSITKVVLRDYSTEHTKVTTKSDEDTESLFGGGELNLFGRSNMYAEVDFPKKDIITGEDLQCANGLPAVVLRAMRAMSHSVQAESTIPWLQAGYGFVLDDEQYQLVSIKHTCNQANDEQEERVVRFARHAGFFMNVASGYRNSFSCHPVSVGAYAADIQAKAPVIPGFIQAKIDGKNSGKYAELDTQGRYKVQFFFPESGKVFKKANTTVTEAGNFSIPLRMMQPHVGKASGMHFPLLKNVEVSVAFMNGDPDRPFILGAIPNPDNANIVTADNHKENILKSPGGHSLSLGDAEEKKTVTMKSNGGHSFHISDEAGKEEIGISTSGGRSYLRFVRS